MNIKFAQTKTEHSEELVTFPIYAKSIDEDETFFSFIKRTSPIHYINVTARKGSSYTVYEIGGYEKIEETVYMNKDFYLGKGKFKCTEEEFNKFLQEAKEWVGKIQ